jgi:Family of unknown function (DUF6272)
VQTEKEKYHFESRYRQLLDNLQDSKTVLVHYNGQLTQDLISQLESNVENSITNYQIPKSPVKKIFFISVETLQNMLIHGHKDHEGHQHNYFIVSKNGTSVEITSANLVSNSAIPTLTEKIGRINSFEDEKALKEYYMNHLTNNEISEKGGAGLGFITIAMKSGNKLKVVFEKITDDFSLFELTSVVGTE